MALPRGVSGGVSGFDFFPTADMFGSQAHHQVPRYFSEDDTDPMAVGMDVFSSSWLAETAPYFCPPWTEITPMLEKIVEDGIACMVVFPERPLARWWPLFESLRTDWLRWVDPLPSLDMVPRMATLHLASSKSLPFSPS